MFGPASLGGRSSKLPRMLGAHSCVVPVLHRRLSGPVGVHQTVTTEGRMRDPHFRAIAPPRSLNATWAATISTGASGAVTRSIDRERARHADRAAHHHAPPRRPRRREGGLSGVDGKRRGAPAGWWGGVPRDAAVLEPSALRGDAFGGFRPGDRRVAIQYPQPPRRNTCRSDG